MSTNSNIRQKLGQLIMMDFRYWGEDSNNQRIPFTKLMISSIRSLKTII